ncbi:benzoate 4-monooxygenase cytochrome [Diplodia corticola]|uniref:Benzoate 4-monooxygenase cytochrome n=1 Tax=Diplodia corticola TaxID=236234 RepID=A0A1J9RM92_9PEZI|nr:benzoate 4-monooxygenase cytochrome [Diplodia corticola]OJD29036.1 benzoate 4-monooxygenase cytochrome [Diplodia corticola]
MHSFFLDLASLAPCRVVSLVLLAFAIYVFGYIIYQRFFHPLAGFPGPFLASVTDLWQAYQFLTLKQPYHLTDLHAKYGPFVRYGPDKLSVTTEDAVSVIYQKGGRSMPKTEFYDAYGAAHPNVFGMRDEAAHSIRRRHMSHSFSISSVKEMEAILDSNVQTLKEKVAGFCDREEAFDLKKVLHYYTIDVLGELAFSQSFGVQVADDETLVPPVKEHSLLAAVTGAWPLMTMRLKRWLPKVPSERLQRLFRGRAACAQLASRCVQRRLDALKANPDLATTGQRKDILTNLILAKHPDTGERLTQTDLETEAFGFIIAGTHTTSATTALLFHHLLHNPPHLSQCVAEIDANLPPLPPSAATSHPISLLESSLPHLRLCIRENFRITPVFTMPLARRVTSPSGITLSGRHIPRGTSIAICNHALHHTPALWGTPSPSVFAPSRWDEPAVAARARSLMHFGQGARQCVGKAVAQTNVYKLASGLLADFEFELADAAEREAVGRGEWVGRMPRMVSVGVGEIEGGVWVRARRRGRRGTGTGRVEG